MTIRGYIRVSTKNQTMGTSLDDQKEAVMAAGATEIYQDVMSGASMDRPGFEKLKADLKPGDTVVVAAFDRSVKLISRLKSGLRPMLKFTYLIWA